MMADTKNPRQFFIVMGELRFFIILDMYIHAMMLLSGENFAVVNKKHKNLQIITIFNIQLSTFWFKRFHLPEDRIN